MIPLGAGSAAIRDALQLFVAVWLAWGFSAALGLPEGSWAVMSALIVVRPSAGATLGAGRDRVRGALAGALCGLLGAVLPLVAGGRLQAPWATLGIVGLLAAASAARPALRSAPITALIVLSGAGAAADAALRVAGLRMAEIAVGVATGVAVSLLLPGGRAGARWRAECARQLGETAKQLATALTPPGRPREQREVEAAAMRERLRALVMLAQAADREARWLRRWRRGAGSEASEPAARLVARIHGDALLFERLFLATPGTQDAAAWATLRRIAPAAIAEGRPADRLALRQLGEAALQEAADATEKRLAGPIALLCESLGAWATLTRHPGESRDPRTGAALGSRVDPGVRRDDGEA